MILYANLVISFDSIEGNGCNCRIERSENLQVTDYEGGLCIDINISILSLQQLKNYHFPNSVRKHVMTRSTLPSIKTKQYINKTKARLENEHLQKQLFYHCIMSRVCDTTIDPMNRYNGDYSLY